MPRPDTDHLHQTTPAPKRKILSAVLDFIHAMRTAPAYRGEEAIEWATLEAEFETRIQNETPT